MTADNAGCVKRDELARRLALEVRERRKTRHMTQYALAQMMTRFGQKWHQTTVDRVEHGARGITFDEAFLLSLIFDISLNEIAGVKVPDL